MSSRCPVYHQSMPRILDSLQRSDGEEEEDGSFTLSPVSHDSFPNSNLLDWKGLTLPLPVTFEQEDEDGISVCLGDLVRQMHPYCMTISVENDEGEQMLPEGGILLEVVDQGENGEPILAIPDMDLPVTLALKETCSGNELKVSEEADEAASDSSEHIVVVDDEEILVAESPVKVETPVTQGLKNEIIVDRQKEEIREKSPSRRKRKKKSNQKQHQPEPVEGRVLRSGRVRITAQEPPKKLVKEEKRCKVPKVSPASTPASTFEEPKKLDQCQTETQETTTTTGMPVTDVKNVTSVLPTEEAALSNVIREKNPPSCSNTKLSSTKPEEIPGKLEDSSAAPSAVLPLVSSESPSAAPSPLTPPMTPLTSEALPPVAPEIPEPKPKALSLAEYRQLRQQKKLAPVEKQDDNSTKWPSLPELPRELPPIPCLPDPSPKDPRRFNQQAAKKDVEEVRPAWQPRGPCAPPTPEALLVPPAYMVASKKTSAASFAPKPQQAPEEPKPSPPKNPPAANSVKNLPSHQQTTAQPAAPCVPTTSEAPASLKPVSQFMSADKKCVPVQLKNQPVSAELTKTTEVIKLTAAPVSAPRKITVVFPKVSEVAAPASVQNSNTSGVTSCKPTTSGTKLCSSTAAHHSDLKSPEKDPVVLESKEKPTTALKPSRAKNPTQELIEAFTSEIGEFIDVCIHFIFLYLICGILF